MGLAPQASWGTTLPAGTRQQSPTPASRGCRICPNSFQRPRDHDHDPRAAWERCGACRPAMQESPFGELGFMPTRGAGSESS